jgi:zinc transport system substrate-binding protein
MACSEPEQTAQLSEDSAGKIEVSVTFNAMKEFVEAVGGDRVVVSTIIPDGMEPHDFEPKAQDLVGLSVAKIFVYNGLGMEPWVPDAINAIDNPTLVIVEASQNVNIIGNVDIDEIEEHGQHDPHAWLSLKNAEIEVTAIKAALVQVDPANAEYYEENCKTYISQLENLYNDYREKFKPLGNKNFVTGHAAFAYLCRDFGLKQNSVEDTFSEGEPTAQQLVALIEYCKANGVTTIFAEELASPNVSQTLANELGAGVDTIYTIESNEDDLSYLQRMESNLSKIYAGLR